MFERIINWFNKSKNNNSNNLNIYQSSGDRSVNIAGDLVNGRNNTNQSFKTIVINLKNNTSQIIVKNEGIFIDGANVAPLEYYTNKNVNVYLNDTTKINSLKVYNGNVSANQVHEVNIDNGSVKATNISGNVEVSNGSIRCDIIGQNATSKNGSIHCNKINGETKRK